MADVHSYQLSAVPLLSLLIHCTTDATAAATSATAADDDDDDDDDDDVNADVSDAV